MVKRWKSGTATLVQDTLLDGSALPRKCFRCGKNGAEGTSMFVGVQSVFSNLRPALLTEFHPDTPDLFEFPHDGSPSAVQFSGGFTIRRTLKLQQYDFL